MRKEQRVEEELCAADLHYDSNGQCRVQVKTGTKEVSCDFYIFFILTMEYLLYCAFKEPTALYFDRVNIAQSQQLKSTELTIAFRNNLLLI